MYVTHVHIKVVLCNDGIVTSTNIKRLFKVLTRIPTLVVIKSIGCM